MLVENKNKWKIKTSGGFVPFHGVATRGIRQLYRVLFEDGAFIEVTDKHVFFTPDGREIQTRNLTEGTELLGIENKIVLSITPTSKDQTYDIIESETHTYFANGLLCHNCQFLSSEALLISSIFLARLTTELAKVRPLHKIRDVDFYHIVKPGLTYLIGVDPATGTGEDFSVITAYEFPSMIQVAEYRSNTMSTNDLYGVLKNILLYLEKMQTTVYFSIENNGVGEGVISLFEADEKGPLNAEFVSEEGKSKRGMTTTAKTKMKACVNLKEMLERGNLKIQSQTILAELKAYVRNKGAYAAQPGSTDDCVAATLIVVRLIEEISTYDQTAFDKLYTGEFNPWSQHDYDGYDDYDENDEGLPISVA